MFKTILFDLDGTLTDPFDGITGSVIYALKKFGIEEHDKNKLKPFIGPPLAESFTAFYGFCEKDALKAVEYYREYFVEKGIFENRVYEGIVPALITLKESGCELFVATSKPEKFAVKIIRHFGLERYFSGICGATDALSGNSKSEVIKSALERYKITDKPEILMVGDRRHDIEGAKANGVMSAGVLYGYGDMSELIGAGADFLVKTPFDLAPRILAAE